MCDIPEKDLRRVLKSWRGSRHFLDEDLGRLLWRASQHDKRLSGYPTAAFQKAMADIGICPTRNEYGFWEIKIWK